MSETTITVWVMPHDDVPFVVNTEEDMENNFGDMLDQVYGDVEVAGYTFDTSRALKTLDPIAWREAFLNYCDNGWTELDMPLDIFAADDEIVSAWIEAQL